MLNIFRFRINFFLKQASSEVYHLGTRNIKILITYGLLYHIIIEYPNISDGHFSKSSTSSVYQLLVTNLVKGNRSQRETQLARKRNPYTELVKSSFTLIIPCLSRGSLTLL